MQYNRTSIYNIQQRKATQVNLQKKDVTVFECNTSNKSIISTSACMLSSSCNRGKQLKLYNLQKDMISTQKQPSCKKGAALCTMANEKVVKYRWWSRNGCDGTKIVITIVYMQVKHYAIF